MMRVGIQALPLRAVFLDFLEEAVLVRIDVRVHEGTDLFLQVPDLVGEIEIHVFILGLCVWLFAGKAAGLMPVLRR